MRERARTKALKLAAEPPFTVQIEALSHEGRGIARREGKTVFVAGALPGEEVLCAYTARRGRHDEAKVLEVLQASPDRVVPQCAHFDICGGCALQHIAPTAQRALKQQGLLENLTHIGKVQPESVTEPMSGPLWGYRRRARLGVKWVPKKGRVLVGFRERNSGLLADIRRCEVLDERVGGLLEALSTCIESLSIRDAIPQIEVAGGDTVMGLNFRVLAPPSVEDIARLRDFEQAHQLVLYLQTGGPEQVQRLSPDQDVALNYQLTTGLALHFEPWHFIQINADINRQLVARTCKILAIQPTDRVLDLFCGLGNFTLALAQHAREVIGVEGDARLVAQATCNAAHNGIKNATFYAADLTRDFSTHAWSSGTYDHVLLDPPRSGALEMIPHIAALGARRVAYVSCHPATLARDVGQLVHRFGYRLCEAGILDMFPHTQHVESLALLER